MELNRKELEAARKRRRRDWARHDDVLYGMCSAYPRHADAASVNANVEIIARTYATGIERKILSNGTQGNSLIQLTDFIFEHRKEADAAITSLRRFAEPLTPDKLKTIVERHGRLVEMLKPLLRDRQASRSFCSKYLHFHCPIMPVYDSYVRRWRASLSGSPT